MPTLKRAARRHFAESLALVNHLQWFQVSSIPLNAIKSRFHFKEAMQLLALNTSQHLFISNPGWHSIAGSAAEFSPRVRGRHLTGGMVLRHAMQSIKQVKQKQCPSAAVPQCRSAVPWSSSSCPFCLLCLLCLLSSSHPPATSTRGHHSKLKPGIAASHLGLSRGSGRQFRCVFRVAHEGHLKAEGVANSRTTAILLKICLKQKSRNKS